MISHFGTVIITILFCATTILGTSYVQKKVLHNGLTILVRPTQSLQHVSMQLWYNVGSKDEQTGQKGLAHFLEHMIFKGTELLSESDIPAITHALSGSCNAATSFDWTHYYFNVPVDNWRTILPIMADCMSNCTFKEDILNAELKVVIQELKMYKDVYIRSLLEKTMGALFSSHPYHYPVIGYKNDLWNLNRESLSAFYKQHYTPNNATLVIVGNVDVEEVYKEVEATFGSIPSDQTQEKQEYYLAKDVYNQTITLYRDVKQPTAMFSFIVPGTKDQKNYITELLSMILTYGKDSILHKKLVDELQICRSVTSQSLDLFDADIFIIICEPYNEDQIQRIKSIITEELHTIATGKIDQEVLDKIVKQMAASFYDSLESNQAQASSIAKMYLAKNDENYIFTLIEKIKNNPNLKDDIATFTADYFKKNAMHEGYILPMQAEEREVWLQLQEASDQEDARVLEGRIRQSELENPQYALSLSIEDPCSRNLPKPQITELENGLTILWYCNTTIPKITLLLDLKGDDSYEPDDMIGIHNILNHMMLEGTKKYPDSLFAKTLERYGINMKISSGSIMMTMLKEDLPIALSLLNDVLTECTLSQAALQKGKKIMHSSLNRFLDNQKSICTDLVNSHLYKNHPYGINRLGSHDSIDKISLDDIKTYYKKVITPQEARLVLSGDISDYDIKSTLQDSLRSWTGEKLPDISWPELKPNRQETITHWMNRDQIVLQLAGLSVDRKHPDYYKLILFDRIFGIGMNSKLFQLRENSGAFYTISGQTVVDADFQPGKAVISTIVSQDRYQEALELIQDAIKNSIDTIQQDELEAAKRFLLHAPANIYSTNSSIAHTFLDLHTYNLGFDFFEKRSKMLEDISLSDVKTAAKKILHNDQLSIFAVGRIGEKPTTITS
jgi:zinc protease